MATTNLANRVVLARDLNLSDLEYLPDTPAEVIGSYFNDFLQKDVPPHKRRDVGVNGVLKSQFPIINYDQGLTVDYVGYRLGEPIHAYETCVEHKLEYAVPIYVTLRILSYGADGVESVAEDEIELGTIPLLHANGTLLKSGVSWIVVSQIIRSPGLYFDRQQVRLVPKIGRWLSLEVERDRNGLDVTAFRIDKTRVTTPVTTMLYALGLSRQDMVERFFPSLDTWTFQYGANGKFRVCNEAGEVVKRVDLAGRTVFSCDNDLMLATDVLNSDDIARLAQNKVETLITINQQDAVRKAPLLNSIRVQKEMTQARAMKDVFKRAYQYAQNPTTEEVVSGFARLFFRSSTYSLSESARNRLAFILDVEKVSDTLTLDLFCGLVDSLFQNHPPDKDFDMSGRRVKFIGDLFEQAFAQGVSQLRNRIRSYLGSHEHNDASSMSLARVVSSSKYITTAMRKFMNSELVQPADQVNPLSETAHKLRLTMTGASMGGMKPEAIPVDARYIVSNQFGRISPLETPDGKNVGIDNLIALYAKRHSDGLMYLPVNPVSSGVVSKAIHWLSPYDDMRVTVSRRDQLVDGQLPELVKATVYDHKRHEYEVKYVPRNEVDYIDAYTNTMTSITAALVPFLEHNEGTRVAMGANMQKQAVPIHKAQSPLVGTGVEKHLGRVSNACLVSDVDGVVQAVDGQHIVVQPEGSDTLDSIRVHSLPKFLASNQNTCINYRPVVRVGDTVAEGDVLADGVCSVNGELALGRNFRVGFMTWHGYNYEDAIIINERLVRNSELTSMHIFTETCTVYKTDHGQEEVTRSIDSLSYKERHALDEYGLPIVGRTVRPGDALVGKVSPKPETRKDVTTQLLHDLFDLYANPYRDASLRVAEGRGGRIIKVDVIYGEEYEGERNPEYVDADANKHPDMVRFRMTRDAALDALVTKLVGQESSSLGRALRKEDVPETGRKKWLQQLTMASDRMNKRIADTMHFLDKKYEYVRDNLNEHLDVWEERHKKLKSDVIASISVTIASERPIQVGDKLAGRHGNKGVISKIVPDEDMPYDSDGNTLDIILSPLGIPSRMNAGQLLETNLGQAATALNKSDRDTLYNQARSIKRISRDVMTQSTAELIADNGVSFAVPPFNSSTEEQVDSLLELGGANHQTELYDGLTGRKFDRLVTTGYIYLMKLDHMADDKLHSRSTGPYNRITQQPLRGKAFNGGQRLGEMEVWALESYGAAYLLQEMMTLKSDNPRGREEIIRAITNNGGLPPEFAEFLDGDLLHGGNSEMFKVLLSELRSLGINMNWIHPTTTAKPSA